MSENDEPVVEAGGGDVVTQPYKRQRLTAAAVFEDLDEIYAKGKSTWCQNYQPVVKCMGGSSDALCYLECNAARAS